jgi:hypothetical protein
VAGLDPVPCTDEEEEEARQETVWLRGGGTAKAARAENFSGIMEEAVRAEDFSDVEEEARRRRPG